MQENSRYSVGLDIGTHVVRCVVGLHEANSDEPTIIGTSEARTRGGMRKGVVVNLNSTAQAIDEALASVERMSGYQIDGAAVSINGSHIASQLSRGRISIGSNGHEITENDLIRAEDDAAAVIQLSSNSEILDVIPSSYQIDGQENVKNPLGMKGIRLEVDANIVTALTPNIQNLHKALEVAHVGVHRVMPAGLAAARAVLTEQGRENGVVMIDIGGSTTSIVVYEEGELQYVSVLPVGGVNITNDLALGLKIDFDLAEQLKLEHAIASPRLRNVPADKLSIKVDKQIQSFPGEEVDEIIEARIEEIFEMVNRELRRIGKNGKLPGGAVLTGGTSRIKGMVQFAREALSLPARISDTSGFSGATDQLKTPGFATALGLMLMDVGPAVEKTERPQKSGNTLKKASGLLGGVKRLFK